MKQIYDFERQNPPVLNENMIRAEIERRRLRCHTVLLVLAGILLQVAIALLGYSAWDWYPWISAVCFLYIVVSAAGGGVVAAAYSKKGGIHT